MTINRFNVDSQLQALHEQNHNDLLRDYFETIYKNQPLLLLFDNAGGCPYIIELLPTEMDVIVIIISRVKMELEPKPLQAIKSLQL